jgi:hypothetical protein
MALSKDQRDKIILGALLSAGVVYSYFEFLIGPLNASQANAAKALDAMEPKIAAAKTQIKATDALKARVPEAETVLAQINQMIPSGAPVAWFPTLTEEFFRSHGIDHITTRMASDVADPLAESFRRINWTIDLQQTDAVSFAAALADFENQQPLVETPSLTIEFLRDTPQSQHITFTVVNTAKKQ